MAQITFQGNPLQTAADLPKVGSPAPDFLLTRSDLADISLANYKGQSLILNIFPSIDTPVCANSVRKFNQEATQRKDVVVLCVSKDLPFAQKRFCAAEGLDQVVTASEYKNTGFSDAYGVRIKDSVLAGLFSRAIVVINREGTIVHTQQVPEITQEPDYASALAAL
jgi:thioredoxin-dependent peroxiredoxin